MAAVIDVFHISNVSWIRSRCLAQHHIVYSLFLYGYNFSDRVYECSYMDANTHTRECKHSKHGHSMHPHTHTNHPPFFSSSPHPVCSFSLRFSHQRSTSLIIGTLHITHTQARKHTQACKHKVARLVGAMAAAPLRGPRVAPGARLPVVCQRLRVEFIQIKAVE